VPVVRVAPLTFRNLFLAITYLKRYRDFNEKFTPLNKPLSTITSGHMMQVTLTFDTVV